MVQTEPEMLHDEQVNTKELPLKMPPEVKILQAVLFYSLSLLKLLQV